MFHRIVQVHPKPDLAVELRYEDGTVGEISFGDVAERGGIFARLVDPAYFERVRVGEDGRYLEWPDELDFCADALYLKLKGVPASAE
jgi:hypothetical protein